MIRLCPKASSIRYTVTLHHERIDAMSQKYAPTLMPVPTPSPYAYQQIVIVDPIAWQVSAVKRTRSRTKAAIAFLSSVNKRLEGGREGAHAGPGEECHDHHP